MGQVPYRPLSGPHEIRVIQLLTGQDDLCHVTGPVHCKVRHVLLEDLNLSGHAKVPRKGYDGTWPSPISTDIEVHPEIRDGADLNELWRRSFMDRMLPWLRRSVHGISHYSLSSIHRAKLEFRTDHESHQDPEAELLWRYVWGGSVALSYVWGDPSVTREIYVDSVPVPVTANLEAALLQLRNHSRIRQGFLIWIDALRINQADLEERTVQVARMNDIYTRAWHTVVWLGLEANNSDLAMMALRFLSLRSREQSPLSGIYRRVDRYVIRIPYFQWKHRHMNVRMNKDALRAIYHIFARPYWRRLWII